MSDISDRHSAATQTDEELVERSKHKDERAFEELMRRYMRQIFNFSRQYARAQEDAEDIAQETFFKVWKYLGKYTAGRQFRPWLYTIARNTALDHLKRKKAAPFSDLDDPENDLSFADTIEDPDPLPSEIFENTQRSQEVLRAMDSLHPEHRAILVLHYHEDMTFEEIAVVVGRPMNTVKSWHRRALMRLRQHLSGEAADRPQLHDSR
ncbi:MAG: RNA polymerase sigma factor [Patescibacteria group bacterium]|nr:RNA polymerase sigma factor [Patescibacteria group bacterium]MDE2172360.1 RNA polymerase sigma factor [Patescibacteria group bacterium]